MTVRRDPNPQLHKLEATKLEMAAHSPFWVTALIQLLLFICALETDSRMVGRKPGRELAQSKEMKIPNAMAFLPLQNIICFFSPCKKTSPF